MKRSVVLGVACTGLAIAAASCGSSGARPDQGPAPVGAPSDGHSSQALDADPAVNGIDPIGSIFEHRLGLALTDSEVAKMVAVDKSFELSARPMRRALDSLRTVLHDWSGYKPEGAAAVDTLHLAPPARDSILRLRDAAAGISAKLQAQARRARNEALDVLSVEQLERLAALSGPLGATQVRSGTMRPNGSGRYSGAYANTLVRSGQPVYRSIQDPLAGITLTDSQRTKIDSIRAAFHAEARALGEPRPVLVAPLRDLIRRQYDAIRSVLTPDQQTEFDKKRGGDAGQRPAAPPGQSGTPGGTPPPTTPPPADPKD